MAVSVTEDLLIDVGDIIDVHSRKKFQFRGPPLNYNTDLPPVYKVGRQTGRPSNY